jgi:hypothetical protein
MKYVVAIPPKMVENILRSPGTVCYEQRLTSDEGEFLVDQKIYKVNRDDRPTFVQNVGGLEVTVDPRRETRTLCWQIPVPHETTQVVRRSYRVSETLTFVHTASECYFLGTTPHEISAWLETHGEAVVRG